jgi:hypothetical protein
MSGISVSIFAWYMTSDRAYSALNLASACRIHVGEPVLYILCICKFKNELKLMLIIPIVACNL